MVLVMSPLPQCGTFGRLGAEADRCLLHALRPRCGVGDRLARPVQQLVADARVAPGITTGFARSSEGDRHVVADLATLAPSLLAAAGFLGVAVELGLVS